MNLSKLRRNAICFLLCPAALLFLVSCSAPALRNQFRDYNEAYADALNQQMLLNLARLENGHPAYYLAIGLIDNKFTFSSQTGAGTTGSFTDSKSTVNTQNGALALVSRAVTHLLSSVFGYSVNQSVTSTSSPEFQFIPLNNEAVSRQVLEPMSTDVFLQLYQQGYPIDQLMRVMIERVEAPALANGEKQLVLINSPTRGTPEYYERFLRTCAILRELQKHGDLQLEASAGRDFLGPVSFSSPGAASRGGSAPKENTESASGGKENSANPAPKDFSDASDKGFVLKTNASGGWEMFQKRTVPKFVLKWSREEISTNLEHVPLEVLAGLVSSNSRVQPFLAGQTPEEQKRLNRFVELANQKIESVKADFASQISEADYGAITNVILALSSGISIQTGVGNNDGGSTRLVLRSFNRSMEAVATEQAGFDALAKTDAAFATTVPPSERRPILRMVWSDYRGNELAPPLETIHYSGKTYQITDPQVGPLDPAAKWNRDVFRLLVALASQVTVDISKFQRQVFELRTD